MGLREEHIYLFIYLIYLEEKYFGKCCWKSSVVKYLWSLHFLHWSLDITVDSYKLNLGVFRVNYRKGS